MSSSAARPPVPSRGGRRVEVYAALAVGGRLLTVPGPDGPRLPGAVLAHGEHPRDAALRAVRAGRSGTGLPAAPDLRPAEVRSDVLPGPGGTGVHVLRLVLEAFRGLVVPVAETLLHHPAPPAPVAGPVPGPGAPPRVQRPAAYAVVTHDDHLLLARLRHTRTWSLPGGGIDHGEHPDDAVRRETLEETGLVLRSAHLVDVDSHHFTGRSPAEVTEDFHGVRLLYRATVAGRGVPAVQEIGGTTEESAWFPLGEVPGLRLNSVVRVALAMLG